MDDLISRQAVIDLLKKNMSSDIEEVITTDKNIKLIESMPCAYNVDAVVAELETMEEKAIKVKNITVSAYACGMMHKAIDIVKRGALNDRAKRTAD